MTSQPTPAASPLTSTSAHAATIRKALSRSAVESTTSVAVPSTTGGVTRTGSTAGAAAVVAPSPKSYVGPYRMNT